MTTVAGVSVDGTTARHAHRSCGSAPAALPRGTVLRGHRENDYETQQYSKDKTAVLIQRRPPGRLGCECKPPTRGERAAGEPGLLTERRMVRPDVKGTQEFRH